MENQRLSVDDSASLAVFLLHESRAKNPFVNLELFKIRRFSFSVASLLVIAISYALTGFLMPFYLQDVLRLSPTKVGVRSGRGTSILLAYLKSKGLEGSISPRR